MNGEGLSPLDRAMLRFAARHFTPAMLERLREEIAAARFDPDEDLPPVRRTGRRYPRALSYRAEDGPLVELELLGHRKPRQQSVEEWIDDVLGPAPDAPETRS